MKNSLRMKIMLLLFALVVGMSNVWAQSDTYTFSEIYSSVTGSNSCNISSDEGSYSSLTYTKNSGTQPKYYANGTAIRLYNGNTLTVSAETDYLITAVTIHHNSSSGGAGNVTITDGSLSGNDYSWSDSDGEVSLDFAVSGKCRIGSIEVTVKSASGGDDPTITVTGTLKDFAFATNDGPSMPQSITVAGSNLEDDITLGFLESCQFEFKKADSEWGNSLTLTETDGTVSATTIYVRMKNVNSTENQSGTITFTSGEAYEIFNLIGHVVTPLTVAEARTAIDQATNHNVSGEYVKGIVSYCDYYSSSNHYYTYYISDDGTRTNELEAFHNKNFYGSDFTAETDIQVGDVVLIFGNMTLYQSTTYEFTEGNYLLTHKTIRASETELENFTYIAGHGPSDAQSFTIDGANLTADLTLSLDENSAFEISESENGGYTDEITLTPSNGAISNKTIYASLKEGKSVGDYEGTITITSTGANSPQIALSGSVTAQTYTIEQKTAPATAHGTINFTYEGALTEDKSVTLSTVPADGYEFTANSWKFYKKGTGSEVTLSVTNNAISMPAYNLQVDATFTAKPTYAITSGVTPANSGTIPTDDEAWEGKEVTVLVEAASGYAFSSLSITKTSDAGTTVEYTGNATDGFTFTMPDYAVTVTASFVAVLDITFTVNGTQKTVKHINQGSQIGELPTLLDSEIPSGFSFMGWTASTNYFSYDDAPELISAYTEPESNTTYAAVFAQTDMSKLSTGTLTSSEILSEFAAAHGYTDDEVEYTDSDDGITWSAKYNGKADRAWLQLKSDNNVYIKIVAPNTIRRVDLTITSTQNEKGGEADITKHSAFNSAGYIYLNSSNGASTHAGSVLGSAVSSNEVSITPTGNNTTLYVQVSVGARVWGISVKHGALSYMNYTTIVTDVDVTGSVTDLRIFESISATAAVTNSGTIHIFDGGVLNMGAYQLTNETPANLIIEDGGQLICSNSVAATVKKTIESPASKVYGWYTISSPVHTGDNSYVTIGAETTVNLTSGSYDMFAYDEASATWINQKATLDPLTFAIDKMYAGQGFMYRSSGNTISFVGNTNYGAIDCALSCSGPGKLKGFNLIGNPYTHSIAKGSGKAIYHANLSTGCYALTNSGTWTPITDGNEILPEQGILVEVSEAVADFKIQDINYSGGGGSKYHNDNIKFTISNNTYEDVAYAWFDKGIGLTKINHRDENAPMLYIPQEGKNYAIATMSDDTKVFGLNFKAATMGQYTLSYKADGNFDYLHIIDRLTGEDIDMLLEGQYTFVATPNDNDNRFIVNLAYKPDYGEGNNENFAYQSGNEILVSGSGELQIFDVTGRSVMTTTINGVESINIPAQGVYIFRLNEKVQKIVVR